jgi:hypothetical protein
MVHPSPIALLCKGDEIRTLRGDTFWLHGQPGLFDVAVVCVSQAFTTAALWWPGRKGMIN